jgi:protein TIF31
MKQGKEESVKLHLDFYDKYTWPLEIAETLLEVR